MAEGQGSIWDYKFPLAIIPHEAMATPEVGDFKFWAISEMICNNIL